MSTRIPESAIERSRPAGIPSDGGGEAALLFHIRAAGLPEPVTQLHFMWCCECPKASHVSYRGYPSGRAALVHKCTNCPWQLSSHAYNHERDWRFDFAWPAQRLAIEVDGGTWGDEETRGRHTRGEGYERDAEKLAEAAIRGWTVIRVTTAMVDDGRALDYIERWMKAHGNR